MNCVIHSRDTECVNILISSPCNGGNRLRLLSVVKLRFGAAAQRRVPHLPSTASQHPAALCAPVHVYYSLSLHFPYDILYTAKIPDHSFSRQKLSVFSHSISQLRKISVLFQKDINTIPKTPSRHFLFFFYIVKVMQVKSDFP